ncbi:MAG TPA: hypothetical protein VFW33_24200 [Gemmataceae bacterium]|nr:hypothetical protein [Gemmataceae bacterium]
MNTNQQDRTKIDPLSGAQDEEPAAPLRTVPKGQSPNATTAIIPGTGVVIKDDQGREVKRVVDT